MTWGFRLGLALIVCAFASARIAGAGQLALSPGPLSRAHASLQGVTGCTRCHDTSQGISSTLCLSCHKPIADRIANRKGVHRAVAGDCQSCHPEHRGADADLRRLDTRKFDHLIETGFALEGRHAALAADCSACHKKRTFLDQRTSCNSCHKDVHKDTLGADCARCHATDLPFKRTRTRFDHARTRFALAGAHRAVACEKCHISSVFKGLHFDTCSSCHSPPHRHSLGPMCTSCHNLDRWTTRTIEHDRTGFPLVGAHMRVACERCHLTSIVKPIAADRCSSCHANPHRESVKEDCRKCHTEATFRGATFDHGVRTRFPLVGKHEGLACRKCHTAISPDTTPLAGRQIDFGGLNPVCASCHKDQHKGEFGNQCDACHRSATFKTAGFVHPRSPEFFGGRHTGVACVRCHVRSPQAVPLGSTPVIATGRATTPSMACSSCHTDTHLGQLSTDCHTCHAIDAPKFAPSRFSHDRAAFSLTGKHRAVDCAKCHLRETRTFPAGTGTARRFKPIQPACGTCHTDPHLGQVDQPCESCHATGSFRLLTYAHTGLDDFFAGFHGRLPCRSCHPSETGQFPAGRGTAIRLKVGRTCRACHPQI